MPSIVKLTLESNQYERNIKNAKKQLNDFTRSIGINMKSLSGMALAAGAVTGALKVAKDAFFANEQQLDEWGGTVEASKSLYNGFLNALNNTDISGFLTRMDDIVSAAREAYNALDDLNTYSAFNQRNEMKERAGYTKALDEYKLNPTADNKKALADANKAVIDGLRETQQKTEDAYMAALRQIATERLNDKKLQAEFVKVFSEGGRNALADAKIGYSQGKSLNFGAQYWYGDRVYDGRIQDRSTGKWRDMSQQEKQDFEFARALSQVNDSQIKEVQALGRQSQAIADQIYQQDRAYNRMAGNNGKVGGSVGGGGRSGGGSTYTPLEGSIDAQTSKVQELQKAWRAAADDDSRKKIKKEIEEQQHILDYMTGKISAPGKMTIAHGITPTSNIDNPLEKYKDAAIELVTPLQQLENELKNLQALQAAAWSPEVFAAYQQRIEEVQGKINVFKGIQKDADASAKSFKDAAGAVSAVGSALSSIEDPSVKIAGIVAQAVANIALAFSKADLKEGETGNIWYWIAATATGLASMITTISSIKAATNYASGGMIKGNSYSGDNLMAMGPDGGLIGLNAGEIVLNKAQTATLANSLQQQSGGSRVVGVLKGEDIVLMADRWGMRTGRGELLFGKNL